MSDQERARKQAAKLHAKEQQRQLHPCSLHIDAHGDTIRTPKQQAAHDREQAELERKAAQKLPRTPRRKPRGKTTHKDGNIQTHYSVHTCRG